VAEEAGPSAVEAPGELNSVERRSLDAVRRFGTVGALLLALGSLGAAAMPVYNPLTELRLLGLMSRMPTAALACVVTGMAMIVLAWLWLGRFVRPGRERLISRAQLDRTLVMWVLPVALVPPMFSKDVYSYLAQSKIGALGLDPYVLGPAQALGVDDPLTRSVPNIWRDTPAPYGPLFLWVGRGITWVAGDHVLSGALLQRVLALGGVAMIVWALPRLARRFGVQPVSALWLGAANPLMIFHLIIGAHNEALMIGLMLAGIEMALRRLPVVNPGDPIPPLTSGELVYLLAGATVITLGAMVKISALPALGFLGVMVARRWGARPRDLLRSALLMSGLAAAVIVIVSLGTGLGFGWTGALGTPGLIKSWLSPMTALGFMGGGLSVLLGLGNHTESTISLMRLFGEVLSVVICVRLLWSAFKGRIHPIVGLGLCLGAVVALGPTVQPWYLLWAVVPLAAAVGASRFRTIAAATSACVAMVIPPNGATFDGRAFVLPQAYLAAAIVVALVVFLARKRLPLRAAQLEAEPRSG
jgi:alpha-1,6-mannosyltransferase